jgi:hypothetical protein
MDIVSCMSIPNWGMQICLMLDPAVYQGALVNVAFKGDALQLVGIWAMWGWLEILAM